MSDLLRLLNSWQRDALRDISDPRNRRIAVLCAALKEHQQIPVLKNELMQKAELKLLRHADETLESIVERQH